MSNPNTPVYQAIKQLADSVIAKGESYLRADVAYELKKFGICSDNFDVSRLVSDAFYYFNKDKNIHDAFATNDDRASLVDDFLTSALVLCGRPADAVSVAQNNLKDSGSILNDLSSKVAEVIEGRLTASGGSNWQSEITGSYDVEEIKAKAAQLFDRYAKMVESYHSAQGEVRDNIEDFTTLRVSIVDSYTHFATALVDIFGDSVKKVAPNIFDFNQIEWLDVDAMLQNAQLQYNNLNQNCETLMSGISKSFASSVQNAVSAYKAGASTSKAVGVFCAGAEMFEHYRQAKQLANALHQDFVRLQTCVKRDATSIKADMLRLLVIHKTLNDVVIPKASAFTRFADELMQSDLSGIMDAIYSQPAIKQLEEQRSNVRRQMNNIEMQINDHLQSIDTYNMLLDNAQQFISSMSGSYNEARARKPQKFLFATSSYNRDYTEWFESCGPFIREYDNYLVDVKLNKDELVSHQAAVKSLKPQHAKLQKEFDELSRQIRKRIAVSDNVKRKVLKHLRPLVAMVQLGRQIAESRIDQSLVSTVRMPDYISQLELPADVDQNLNQFKNLLSENIQGETPEESQLIQGGINLLDSYMRLEELKSRGKMIGKAYDAEYEKIADAFAEHLKKVDDKSAYVRSVLAKVNTANSAKERKQALLLLNDVAGTSLSEADFDAFLRGDFQITL